MSSLRSRPHSRPQREHGRDPAVGVRDDLFGIRGARSRTGHRLCLSRPGPVGPAAGERTGEVVARRTARVRSWPGDHLAEMAEAVAEMAVAVALVFGYWAAGGSFGLSGSQPHPSVVMQASRVLGRHRRGRTAWR